MMASDFFRKILQLFFIPVLLVSLALSGCLGGGGSSSSTSSSSSSSSSSSGGTTSGSSSSGGTAGTGPHLVGGIVSGLGAGKSVTIGTSGTSNNTISSNGFYTFTISSPTYNFSVVTQPTNQVCSIVNGAGNIVSSGTWVGYNGNINIICGPSPVGNFVSTGTSPVTSSCDSQIQTASYPSSVTYYSGSSAGSVNYIDGTSLNNLSFVNPVIVAALADGRVLAGWPGGTYIDSRTTMAQPYSTFVSQSPTTFNLYNPTTGTWSASSNTLKAKAGMSVTSLLNNTSSTTNKTVLIVGGYQDFSTAAGVYGAVRINVNMGTLTSSNATLFNPLTNTWSATGSLTTSRAGHTATLLLDGRVLVSGGFSGHVALSSLTSAELFDPTTNTWSATGSMSFARVAHAATLLPNGQVLVVGGNSTLATELYDPATGSWSPAANINVARTGMTTSTLLSNGKVLVAGGGTTFAELYDPVANTWSLTGSMLNAADANFATLLPSGKVLVVGVGYSSEEYDPTSGIWKSAGTMSVVPQGLTLLANGEALIVGGGINASTASTTATSCGYTNSSALYW